MEFVIMFLFAWVVVSLPAIIFTAVANSRRRNETADLFNKINTLTRQLENLERRTRAESAPAQAMPAPPAAAQAPAMKISAEETRAAAITPSAPPVPTPVRGPLVIEKPETTAVPPPPLPSPAAPSIAAQQHVETKAAEAGGISLAQKTPPAPVVKPAPLAGTVSPPPIAQVPERVAAMLDRTETPDMASSAQARSAAATAGFSRPYSAPATGASASGASAATAARKSGASLEERIGTNWLPKLGIAIIVIGVGFLIATMWGNFGPWLRVLILYAGAGGMLAAGILTERRERYRTIGCALIGGGWAVTLVVTYALRHVPSTAVLPSDVADLALLLGVLAVVVWHTLRYDSQLVTGAAFLLGFTAITLNPDPPYNLIAGALLVAGMTVIVHRYRWWELEVFGILASYLNHFYWLYTIFGLGPAREFPHHTVSLLLVAAYWAVFRFSYVWRTVSGREEESVSTIAGLLNPLLFLGVMKYQSLHPEWAFYGLLGLGAMEFLLGQLPPSRKRVVPFHVLSSLGAALMVAAVPFKYSGDSLEVLWLVGAETFLLAGIFLRERLFRGFGLIISGLIVLYTLAYRVPPLAQEVMNGQQHYHPALGMVLVAIAVVLYANAHVVRRRWARLFAEDMESLGLNVLSFCASVLAVCAVYAYINEESTAIVLALLVAALTLLGRQFSEDILIYQAHWIAAVVFVQTISSGVGVGVAARWRIIPERALIFVPPAALLYLSSRHVRLSRTNYKTFFAGLYTWAATALLAVLIWLEMPQPWIALAWMALAVLLATAARAWKVRYLLWQTHVLSVLAAGWTLYDSFAPQYRGSGVQLISVGATAGLLYLLNWITNIAGVIEDERLPQAYSWAGSLLVSWLIWYQVQPVSVSLAWAVLGLLLFELGNRRSWLFLRIQAYVALTCSFAHIFYANFNVLSTGGFGPEVITVVPLVPIYFWIYWQLHERTARAEGKVRVEYLLACLGTATLAALARFELPLDSVVIGYAAIMLAALLVAWLLRLQIFLYQALIMLGMAAFRVSMHNFYHLHEAFSFNLSGAVWAIALMAAGVPVCLVLRRQNAESISAAGWIGFLGRRPEQPMFFVPFVLLAVLLYLKIVSGMISLAWGAEATLVYVLALWAKERSFRLAGLGLLLLVCVPKLVWDVWQLHNTAAGYLTLIGVGALMFVISILYSRNKEALREYL
jgi:Predicted membrane protein (DUF2339)